MGYYSTTKRVNIEISEVFKKVLEGMSVSVDLLVISLTEKYEIGELYIRKRINLKISTSERMGKKIILENGVIKCQA